jgi:hypothetical protein
LIDPWDANGAYSDDDGNEQWDTAEEEVTHSPDSVTHSNLLYSGDSAVMALCAA